MSALHWSEAGYAAIGELVRERAGLLFSDGMRRQAESTIARVMRRGGQKDSLEYAAILRADGAALDDLLAELTVGETYFFREPAQFAYIRERLVSELRERHGRDHVVRAWSAGCATGEEAYSLGMTLRAAGARAQVIGTDISRARLAFARRAAYRPWSLRGVREDAIRQHFTARGGEFVLGPTWRDAVDFRYLNLACDVYPAISTGIWGMDVILCRNVLIYLDADTIARVAQRLIDTLAENGVLFLGAADPLLTEYLACEVVKTDAGVGYRRLRRAPVAGFPGPAPAEVARASWKWDEVIDLEPAAPPPPSAPEAGVSAGPPAPPQDEAISAAYAACDYDLTVMLARRRLALGPDESAFVALVRALANLGRLEEAGRECASALDVHRTSAELLYLHAVLLGQAGRLEDSAAAARRVLYLDRGFVVGHLALAGALARTGDRAGALRAYAAAERLLGRMNAEAPVPASDGEPAGRLLEMARLQKRLLERSAA